MIKKNKYLGIIDVKFFVFFIMTISVFSQKKVIDSLSKEPISFVEIYSENGDIIGTTNYKGEISKSQLNKIKLIGVKQLFFNHNNYQKKNILIKEFLNSDKIDLVSFEIQKTNILDEVVLFSKSKKKYIKFTAYFRNVQFNNDQPQYFMDGIVEYYIANKSGKIKICVLQNRSLKDKTIKQIDEKGLIRLNFNIAGVPNLKNFVDFQNLKNEYQINKLGNEYFFHKAELEIGKIKTVNNNLFLNLEIFSEENPKIMKLFGTESILKSYTVNTIYNKTENINLLKDILYFKEYREYDIKQKKDKDYSHINCINEVYIIDKQLTDDEPSSKDNFYSFIDKSNYVKPFWENIKNDYIIPITKTVGLFIKSKLSE